MRSENYSWRIYTESCAMVAYITDTNHTPDKWQEVLAGREKGEAIVIVEQDRTAAEEIPNGEGYKQTTLNKGERIYLRTSKQTGNSWEVRLDEDGDPEPNPCQASSPPDPRNVSVSLKDSTLTIVYNGQQFSLNLKGTAVPPTV